MRCYVYGVWIVYRDEISNFVVGAWTRENSKIKGEMSWLSSAPKFTILHMRSSIKLTTRSHCKSLQLQCCDKFNHQSNAKGSTTMHLSDSNDRSLQWKVCDLYYDFTGPWPFSGVSLRSEARPHLIMLHSCKAYTHIHSF